MPHFLGLLMLDAAFAIGMLARDSFLRGAGFAISLGGRPGRLLAGHAYTWRYVYGGADATGLLPAFRRPLPRRRADDARPRKHFAEGFILDFHRRSRAVAHTATPEFPPALKMLRGISRYISTCTSDTLTARYFVRLWRHAVFHAAYMMFKWPPMLAFSALADMLPACRFLLDDGRQRPRWQYRQHHAAKITPPDRVARSIATTASPTSRP